MSVTQNIRNALGLGEKQNPNVTNLPPDYFDSTQVEAAAPVDEEPQAPAEPTEPTEQEAIEAAAKRLEAIDLPPGAWSLIDRALDSLANNTGSGLQDEQAKAEARHYGALVKACDNDLSVLTQAIIATSPATDAAGNVYSTLYRVLKNVVFFGNLDYRQAQGMDTFSDEATVQAFFDRYVSSEYVDEALARVVGDQVLSADDTREKEQEDQQRSDQGFEARRDIELRYLFEKYGATDVEEAVVQALEDIQLMFQLTCESLGWDPARPMPFGNVQNPDGVTFTPIHGAVEALDAAEIARQASQKRRREARAAMLTGAAQAAAAIVARSLQRPNVHTKR